MKIKLNSVLVEDLGAAVVAIFEDTCANLVQIHQPTQAQAGG